MNTMVVMQSTRVLVVTASAHGPSSLIVVAREHGWKMLNHATRANLLRELETQTTESLLFWLDNDAAGEDTVQLISFARNRWPAVIRVAATEHVHADIERSVRAAGVHVFIHIHDEIALSTQLVAAVEQAIAARSDVASTGAVDSERGPPATPQRRPREVDARHGHPP